MSRILQPTFRILCAILLIFSTMAPSLASANTASTEKLIYVDLANEERQLISARAYIVGAIDENGYSNQHYLNYNSEQNGFVLNPNYFTELDKEQRVMFEITYSENDEQYVYFDEQIMSTVELLGLTKVQVPALEGLQVTQFVNDLEGENKGHLHVHAGFKSLENYSVNGGTSYVEKYIAKKKDSDVHVFARLETAVLDAGRYIVLTDVTFEQSEVSLAKLNKATVKVKNGSDYFVELYDEKIGFGFTFDVGETLFITPNDYRVSYGVNGDHWMGHVSILSETTLALPVEVEKYEFKMNSISNDYYDPKQLNLHYDVKAYNGNFELVSDFAQTLTAQLLDGDKVVAEAANVTKHYAQIQLDKVQSGQYTLQLKRELASGEYEVIASEMIDVTSPWNELQGTVFTAENIDGELLEQARINIYQFDENYGYYRTVFSSQINTEYNEMFVPSTYIHEGHEYLVVIESYEDKVLYAKTFVGQQSFAHAFKKDELKQVQVKTGDLITESTSLQVIDPASKQDDNGNVYYQSLPIYPQQDWHIAVPSDIIVDWTGTNADGTVGYNYRGFANEALTVDVTKAEWKTYAAYPNTKLNATIKGYPQFKIAGDVMPFFGVNVEKDGITYTGYVTAETEEVVFGKVNGYVQGASSTMLAINYSSYMMIDYANFEFEISGGEGFEPITVETDYMNQLTYEHLPPGEYKLKLVKSTVDPAIVDLAVDTTFTVYGDREASTGETIEFPYTLEVAKQTPYGIVSPWNHSEIRVTEVVDERYESTILTYFTQNGVLTVFDSNTIYADKTYNLHYYVSLENGDVVIDKVTLTGKEIEALFKAPIQIQDGLYAQTIEEANLDHINLEVTFSDLAYASVHPSLKPNAKLYLPKGYVKITATNFGKEYLLNATVFEGTIEQANTFKIDEDLASVQVLNNGEALPLFGIGVNYNFSYRHNLNTNAKKALFTKAQYDDLAVGVVLNAKNDTAWGYELSKSNIELKEDQTFNFDANIKGSIESITSNGYSIDPQFKLTAGDLNVSMIFNAKEEQQFRYSIMGDEPIVRPYYGLFNNINRVTAQYEVLDANDQVIAKGAKQFNPQSFNIYLDELLADGDYTLKVQIPVAAHKTLTLEKEFTVGNAVAEPSVRITSDIAAVTNAKEVTVAGNATNVTALQAKLLKDGAAVETKQIAVTDNRFEVKFAPAADGNYVIEVGTLDGAYTSSVNVTIDRAAPAKATDVQINEATTGLQVTWKAVEDAVSYKVQVAKNDGEFTTSAALTNTAYTITPVEAGATYKVRVIAIDAAGNESVSAEVTKEIAAFVATTIALQDARNTDGLLVIGKELAITLTGAYKEGYQAIATVVVDGAAKEVALTYNEEKVQYEGSFKVEAGMQQIDSIRGVIVDGDNKTNELAQDIKWAVGATVVGQVTDGTAVEKAAVRLESATKAYTATTDAEGKYTIEGMQPGEYVVKVTVSGRTLLGENVKVQAGEIVENTVKVPAFVSPTISFVDSINGEKVESAFYVKVTDGKKFTAYGEIKDGKFAPYTASQMKNIETGEYTITVYGNGLFQETTEKVTFTKDVADYTVKVSKIDAQTKAITLVLPEGVEKLTTVSLYNYDVVKQFNYSGLGDYYYYDVAVQDGKVVIDDVAASNNYQLYVTAEGYMPFQATVDLTTATEVEVALEQGRVISGVVTDAAGNPIANEYVYAYGDHSYASATTDAEGKYELIGLDKSSAIAVYISSSIYLADEETVEAGKDNVTLNFELAKAGIISGTVTDKDGNVLSDVSVSAYGNSEHGYYSSWTKTGKDGIFSLNGLNDLTTYTVEVSSYGYPAVTLKDVKVGKNIDVLLQKEGKGSFDGEGNFLSAAKSTVVEGDRVQFTLAYANNGDAAAKDVAVALTLPAGLTLVAESVQLNGKDVAVTNGEVIIPEVAQGAAGKVTFDATVGAVDVPTLTVTAQVAGADNILSASVAPVFVTLQAPAQTSTKEVKVYGTAKYGATVEVYAGDVLVGQTKVDGKWWHVNATLPVTDAIQNETFALTAKVKDGDQTAVSKPVTVQYAPSVPAITDVTVYAGWNGDVKLNPYTGVATFAITENTPMNTTIVFDQNVDEAKLNFLGKEYKMDKGSDNKFTFDGDKLGRWTSYGEQLLTVTYKKDGIEVTVPLMNIIVLIDPSGFVFEDSMDNKLEGVKAVVEVKNAAGEWVIWDAAKFGQVNPQTTDAEGKYGWDVIAGEWRVIFTKEGYEPYISRVMTVPPAETELNIPMVKIADPIVTTTKVSEKDLTIAFDRYMAVQDDVVTLVEVTADGEVAVAGSVKADAVNGYKVIATPEDKKAGFAGNDSNDESGFFAEDASKKLAKAFTFVPTAALQANKTYKLIVSANATDAAGKTVGTETAFEFTTAAGSGGGSGSGGGGGTVAPPAGGGGATTPPATGNVTEADVDAQLAKGDVIVEAPAATAEAPATVTVDAAALAKVAAANKSFTVKAGEVAVEIPAAALQQLAKDGKAVQFEVKASAVAGALTPAYSFTATIDGAAAPLVEPAQVAIPVDAAKVKAANKVAAYTFDAATNSYKYVLSKYENGVVTFKTKQPAAYVVMENDKTFKDVANSWAREFIDPLASKGIIQGKTADTFAPEAQITRTQFAVLLTRMLNLETESYKGTFSDVSANNWAAAEIEAAAKAGIITGSNGKFMPNDNITRQQMVAMIVRAMRYVDPATVADAKANVTFADAAKIQTYAKESVEIAVALGIISGKQVNGQTVFAPADNATRAQAAKMLYVMLEQF